MRPNLLPGLAAHPRARRQLSITAAFAAIALTFSGPVSASHTAPVISAPTVGAQVRSPVAVAGTVPGDAALVRIFDGGIPVADTAPSGGHFSLAVALADGAHTLSAAAMTSGGTWSPMSSGIAITVDTVAPPVPAITAPADGQIVPFRPVVVEGTAEPFSTVRIEDTTGDTFTATTGAGGTWSVSRDLGDTTHTLEAVAVDKAGNESGTSAPVTFVVDTLPPHAPIIYTPGQGVLYPKSTLDITGSAEPGSTVELASPYPFGSVVAAANGEWSLTRTFADGKHTLTARARDTAGHVSEPSPPRTFVVDTTPPLPPVIETPGEGVMVATTVQFEGRAEEGATVELLQGGVVVAAVTTTRAGTWSAVMVLGDGQHRFTARAIDAAGNRSAASDPRTFIVDGQPPTVRVDTIDGSIFLPGDAVRVRGTARDERGVRWVHLRYYDLLGRAAYSRFAICNACPLGLEVSWFSEDVPLGRYTVVAQASDRVGNLSVPAVFTITNLDP